MTLEESDRITSLFAEALQSNSEYNVQPLSALHGYNVFDIDVAFKLFVANSFLILSSRRDFEEQYSALVASCDGLPKKALYFVPDEEIEKLRAVDPNTPEFVKQRFQLQTMTLRWLDNAGNYKDQRIGNLETLTSFSNYCKSVGAGDPSFWKKIYTRIDLQYLASSPQGNTPTYFNHRESHTPPIEAIYEPDDSRIYWISAILGGGLLLFGTNWVKILGALILLPIIQLALAKVALATLGAIKFIAKQLRY